MRKILLFVFALTALLTMSVNKAEGKGVIIWGTSEKIKKIADLPDSAKYQSSEGKAFDLGVKYTTFHIFWVPLWVTEKATVCGYVDKDNYVELSPEEIEGICKENNLDITKKVKPAFWDQFGGKAILLVLISFALWGYFSSKKEDEEEKETAKP